MYVFDISAVERQVLDFMTRNDSEPAESLRLELDGIFTDSWPAGWICNWRIHSTPLSWRWAGSGNEPKDFFSSPEYKEMCRRSEEHQQQLRAELEERKKKAKVNAAALWNMLYMRPKQDYPYLVRKNVYPHNIKLQQTYNAIRHGKCDGPKEGELVIPLRDIDGNIQTLQFIEPDGTKRFFPDAPVKGAFFSIGDNVDGPILICEGYATCSTIYGATGLKTVAAMNAGNIMPVAEALKGNEANIAEEQTKLLNATHILLGADGLTAVHPAKYWRHRSGTADQHTSFSIGYNICLAAAAKGLHTDYHLVWDMEHGSREGTSTGTFIDWIKSICR